MPTNYNDSTMATELFCLRNIVIKIPINDHTTSTLVMKVAQQNSVQIH